MINILKKMLFRTTVVSDFDPKYKSLHKKNQNLFSQTKLPEPNKVKSDVFFLSPQYMFNRKIKNSATNGKYV